jgi:hypothetical protein
MTNDSVEAKALALLNEVWEGRGYPPEDKVRREDLPAHEALCRALEQLEAFKQEVSDAVKDACKFAKEGPDRLTEYMALRFAFLIIPKPKPDPLVEVLDSLEWCNTEALAKDLRAELEAFGLEIREKGA